VTFIIEVQASANAKITLEERLRQSEDAEAEGAEEQPLVKQSEHGLFEIRKRVKFVTSAASSATR
jgi:hypothetical protein